MSKKQSVISLVALALATVALVVVLLSREPEAPVKNMYKEYSLDYFDTPTVITGYEQDEETFRVNASDILNELEQYHKLFDIYHRYGGMENLCTINKLNENGEHNVVKVDRKIIDMLLYAKEMYVKTNGKMNIAMGSVLSIWHDYREKADEIYIDGKLEFVGESIPSKVILEEAAKHTDINDLIIDEENCTVYLADPEMKLDVGAIAKGYAVEMIAKMLEERGIAGYLLNVGGNVRAVGLKENGEKWVAAITNPIATGASSSAYLAIEREAIVTSGSYQRYYIVDGKEYHHIIDGETLMPADYFVAVSIICKHSGMGDGLSTALFCMPLEEGMAIIDSLDGVEAMWTFPDGTIVKSSGFETFEVEYNP